MPLKSVSHWNHTAMQIILLDKNARCVQKNNYRQSQQILNSFVYNEIFINKSNLNIKNAIWSWCAIKQMKLFFSICIR